MGTLKFVLKDEQNHLGWGDKWNIAYDIATELKYSHDEEVCCKLNTANVLIYKEDNEVHAKIPGFNFCLLKTKKANKQSANTSTNKYTVPERVLGNHKYELKEFSMDSLRASDVKAFGKICEALIKEAEPYPNKENIFHLPSMLGNEKLYQKLNESKYPPMFFKLTHRCLADKPEAHLTAKKVVQELVEMKSQMRAFKT